ncbi:MAG: sigma 54-interacting transcriptional regulator [Acidobacteriota bacterium]
MQSDETDWRSGTTRQETTASDDESSLPARVPALTLLAHPDARRVGERVALPQLALGHGVSLSRLEPTFKPPGPDERPPRPLADRTLSRRPIRLLAGPAEGEIVVDLDESRTVVSIDGEPVAAHRTVAAAEIDHGTVLLLGRRVALLLHRMELAESREETVDDALVGASDAVVHLHRDIERLAPLDVPVLLRGESGTGKELVAHALHTRGPRRERPFVAVNMATLTPSLAAAELFGAVRGAFTGADRKKRGLFQSAHRGTLFLDEIGDTPSEVQAMLLRALESREVLPVGGVEAQPVDVRVIAATDARLEEAMAEGRFRAPLYHRLAGYALRLPPLRERRDDIGRLLRFFLEQFGAEQRSDPGIRPATDVSASYPPADLVARLARHDWPGNVRELRNVARRLALAADASRTQLLAQIEDVLETSPGRRASSAPAPPSNVASETVTQPTRPTPRRLRRDPAEVDEDELLAALEANDYRMRDTAEALGLSRIGLYRRIDQSPHVVKAADLDRPAIDDALRAASGDIDAAARALRVSAQGLKRRITALRRVER